MLGSPPESHLSADMTSFCAATPRRSGRRIRRDDDENRRRLQPRRIDGRSRIRLGSRGAKWGGVVEVLDPELQTAIAEMRAAGLNIMMSMKDGRRPISFVEDCAVPLPHLAEYTARLSEMFEKNGTRGTGTRIAVRWLPARAPGAQSAARQGCATRCALIAEEAFAHGA